MFRLILDTVLAFGMAIGLVVIAIALVAVVLDVMGNY
jgi:hypothetical protein